MIDDDSKQHNTCGQAEPGSENRNKNAML
jgi:hypothetical protein